MLNLTGPQTLTIFAVNSAEFIPVTAAQSSITAPQGYHCRDNDSMHLFIAGEEYIYIAKSPQGNAENRELSLENLENRVSKLENTLLKPLEAAFKGY